MSICKIYVEDGPKENYKAIDWNGIEGKLEASSYTSVQVDPSTTCKSIIAKISDGKIAKLGAMFICGWTISLSLIMLMELIWQQPICLR